MLSPNKLKENAVTSIRLGVEDFQRAIAPSNEGGDPERAISAARNLFAGMLLLFKYGLAMRIVDPKQIDAVLFNPPRQIIPHPNGSGGVEWRPVGRFAKQTIDVAGIKDRFEAFKIVVDWGAMEQLQNERNNLEHLHPTQSVGAIAGFIADMFPILQAFVIDELDEAPAEFLGISWGIMLKHRAFFEAESQRCFAEWEGSGLSDAVKKYFGQVRCEDCSSTLLKPMGTAGQEYECVACAAQGPLIAQISEIIEQEEGGYNPYDGDEAPVLDCPCCKQPLFVVSEGACRGCDYELEHWECDFCETPLGLDDQHNGGLCGYCEYRMGKDD
jgi:hypothetical protein